MGIFVMARDVLTFPPKLRYDIAHLSPLYRGRLTGSHQETQKANSATATYGSSHIYKPMLVYGLCLVSALQWSAYWVLNVVDDYSREMVGQLVSASISGRQVARFLNFLIEQRGKPNKITCDNGTEFTSKAMFFWAKETEVGLSFIQPEEPTQNAFVESLNGKFRNECLNQHWFRMMNEARYEIDL